MPDDQCARHLLDNRDMFEKVVETHNDVKHILISLDAGKEMFKDHDKRIRRLEHDNQFTKGKLVVLIMVLGGAVTLLLNFFMWLASKFGGTK